MNVPRRSPLIAASFSCLLAGPLWSGALPRCFCFSVRGADPAPAYANHADLSYYVDAAGGKHPIRTSKDWEERRRHILAHLRAVMGPLPEKNKRVPLAAKVHEEVRFAQFTRRLVSYETDGHARVQAYLFLPAKTGLSGKTGKRPAVLCLHQTMAQGKAEPAGLAGEPSLHYALHLAERGFVTLAPDYPSFGTHKWDFHPKHGYQSGTMKAIWDNIRAVDYLLSLPEVDGERIGVIGHSLGGHNAMFTAAFEPRLQVIVSSCGFTSFANDDMPSWTGPRYMPRIASVFKNDARQVPFDFPEIIATFAPRPFLACAAVKDRDFDVAGVKTCMAAAKEVFGMFDGGVPRLQAYYPNVDHSFPDDARKIAYKFLADHLK